MSRKFERKEFGSPIPNTGGFTVIGLDQVLHYCSEVTLALAEIGKPVGGGLDLQRCVDVGHVLLERGGGGTAITRYAIRPP